VRGQITGFGLDVGIIDDPMKGRAEAQSLVARNMTWDWFADDFFARFSKDAGLIMILTRWHVDDPAGRWIERFPDTKVLRGAGCDRQCDRAVEEGARCSVIPSGAYGRDTRS